MAGKRYNQEQILSIVKEHEEGLSMQDVISKYGVTKTTFSRWRKNVVYKEIEFHIKNNHWDQAIGLAKQLPQKDLVNELQFWQKLGAQVRSSSEVSSSNFIIKDHIDLVLHVSGNVHLPGNFSLDTFDDNKPWIQGRHSIVIDGDLKVDGGIENLCPNSGTWLIVSGGITADYLIGGGSVIEAGSTSEFKYAVIGHYNDGAIYLNGVNCPFLWSEDHILNEIDFDKYPNANDAIEALGQCEIQVKVTDDTEFVLDLIQPKIRKKIEAQMREDYLDEIEEEGDDYIMSMSVFEEYLLYYLFDEEGEPQFEYVFNEIFNE